MWDNFARKMLFIVCSMFIVVVVGLFNIFRPVSVGSLNPSNDAILVAAGEVKITTANLNMRTGPGTGYPVILMIPKGSSVSITGYSGSWAKVSYAGKTGYASTNYLTNSKVETYESKITTANLYMRTGPGTGYPIILTIPKGSTVGVTGYSGSWAKASYAGKNGYCSTNYLTTPSNTVSETKYTTADLNLRTGPGTSYSVLLVIPKGSQVTIGIPSNGWVKASYHEKSGYVNTSYLSSISPGSPPVVEPDPETGAGVTVITQGTLPYSGKRIALTFDDQGDSNHIHSILDTLDRFQIKATFFPKANWIRSNPDLALKLSSRGHSIGSHSVTHPYLDQLSETEIREELRESKRIIQEVMGVNTPLIRPPFGIYDDRVVRIAGEEGYRYIVLWTINPRDYDMAVTVEQIVDFVIGKAANNGIVLLHMGSPQTLEALPILIQSLKDMGYTFAKVDQMLP